MTLRISSILAASMVLWAGITLAGCECIDCNRAGPIVGYIRTLVQDESGSPVSGASVHLDNRSFITEPQTTEPTAPRYYSSTWTRSRPIREQSLFSRQRPISRLHHAP